MAIIIKTSEAKIESTYKGEFIIEFEKITNIDANINDVLNHFEYDDVAEYKDIYAVVECLDTDKVLDRIDNNDIFNYILNDNNLVQGILDMMDDTTILAKARKLKIENLLQNEK